MNYPKSLFYNFLTVYFANHLLPGIELLLPMRIPHFGYDLPFAVVVGLLNSLIYPVCKLVSHHTSAVRIAMIAVVLNFAVYAILKIAPLGIHILTMEGYLIAAFVVAVASFVTNYLYMRAQRHYPHKNIESEHSSTNNFDDWKNPPS
ncbi:MAG TPA: hypothetical protein VGO47_12480 [Chlamydiales bacterium]|jgi:uncharacterized membrane protein YvlD (DUF360 family)|nr:hypothetical protein [Chlamydiales bacterium]